MCLSQEADLRLSSPLKKFIFVAGFIECALFGGANLGWPQLVHILKAEGVYESLCDSTNKSFTVDPITSVTETTTVDPEYAHSKYSAYDYTQHKSVVTLCEKQDQTFALIFTLSAGSYGIPGILIGYILHSAGLRFSRIVAGVLLTSGFFFIGLTTKDDIKRQVPDSPNWLFPGAILIAVGGNQIRMCAVQLGELFPDFRSTAIALMSGVYITSGALFLLLQSAVWVGIHRSYVCLGFAACALLIIPHSFLMPPHHIPVEKASTQEKNENWKEKQRPLKKCLCSLSFLLVAIWTSVLIAAATIFQQRYNLWISRFLCSFQQIEKYSTLYSYSVLLTVFTSPLGGLLTDVLVAKALKNAKNDMDFRIKQVQASFLPLFITTLLVGVHYSCLLFNHPVAIYVSMATMVITRPSILAVGNSFMRIRFSAHHINLLMGLTTTIAAIVVFFQYFHFLWAEDEYLTAHLTVLVLIALTASLPLHLLWTSYIRQAVTEGDGQSVTQCSSSIEAKCKITKL